ncbi:MAG TPA: aldolase/citrate lyase family protein [Bacillales bacterium]|nr:aldolase/citrate lyase family protein [Bacillales bacterium]
MGNLMKEKLKNGEDVLGAFINFFSPSLVEMIGYAGFEFVIIDNEHGAFSSSETEHMIRAAEIAGLVPIVRVSYDAASIQKALDRGAKGIQVPMVNHKDDAKRVVKSAKYPPEGIRGTAYSIRPAQFGKKSGSLYLREANDETLVVVHIETVEAVRNIDEILSVSGIDVVFIGTVDLAVNMGHSDDVEHEDVQLAIQSIYEKAEEKEIPVGTVAGSTDGVLKQFAKGARYVGVVANSVISAALEAVVDKNQEVNGKWNA